jgi:hypothetical protein
LPLAANRITEPLKRSCLPLAANRIAKHLSNLACH